MLLRLAATVASQDKAKHHCHSKLPCRYLIPGGSAGHFQREGYTFDVGSSMMFGLGQHGTTNLITRALAAVGKSVETAPDPTQIHYHLPKSAAHPEVMFAGSLLHSETGLAPCEAC